MKKFICLLLVTSLFSGFAAKAQDSTNKEMAGKYKFPDGSIIPDATITWDSGILNMNSVQGSSVLERIKGDTFNVVSFSGIVVFKRNEAKKITGVHVDVSGYVFDGVKDDTANIDDEANKLTMNLIRDMILEKRFARSKILGCIVE